MIFRLLLHQKSRRGFELIDREEDLCDGERDSDRDMKAKFFYHGTAKYWYAPRFIIVQCN